MRSTIKNALEPLQTSGCTTTSTHHNNPSLPDLSDSEMTTLCKLLSSGKAISYDLFSDIIFTKSKDQESKCCKLKDIWNGTLDKLNSLKVFSGRIVALNKIHPNIPTPNQFRPIIVLSALIKLAETRFLLPLNQYMKDKMILCQTGFVKGMGTFVNIHRMLNRIHLKLKRKCNPIILFIDFS